MLDDIISEINNVKDYKVTSTVTAVKGLLIKCKGISNFVNIGSSCQIYTRQDKVIPAEVIAVDGNDILLMSFQHLSDLGIGCTVEVISQFNRIYPDQTWLGRVIDSLGQPLDGKGKLLCGQSSYGLHSPPPPAYERRLVNKKLDLGISAINTFTPCCYGQRMGIFAGSGVGKSVLLSMISRFCTADVKVIGLIGERGREVQQFLQEHVGSEGLKNTILVVATSDESALMRKQAALLSMTIAEYFRDQGLEVLCLIDSITRFAMAQREIGLCIGEIPTTKGYTSTVFSEMSRLLERAGPGTNAQGNITGLFTILVEGDDTNEPISDAIRSILDGHIILDRSIAERGRFPAINVLRSVSRALPACNNEVENQLIRQAKRLLSTYSEMEDMIKLGAYNKGSDREVDQAIHYYPLLEDFLSQGIDEKREMSQSYDQLASLLKGD